MCGRFTLHSRLNLLLQQFAIEAGPEWAPRYNIAPTQWSLVVREPIAGRREMVRMRWGLIPSWAKETSIGQKMINARCETVAEKPSFRSAFKKRRCLVPADGYFEWKTTDEGKQPYCIRLQDETPFAMAGLWEAWHTGRDDALETFTIITTDAAPATQSVHDRMPVILHPDDYALWLDPEFEGADQLKSMLRPLNFEDVRLDRVSRQMNSPKFDDPSCIVPLE